MSQTIKRGGKSVRKAAAAQGKDRQVRAAKARTGSAIGTAMGWLPISEEQWQRVFLASILGGAAVLAWTVASFAGVPAMAEAQLAQVASDAGFEVRRVEVRGVKNLNELKVYERALAERDRAMPLVDVEALRQELLQLSWVQDARVSRQLPDSLVIDIVERTPAAVLRKADKLVLIDATGAELEVVGPARAKGKLIVSGPGAGKQVVALQELMSAAPALKPQLREAEWIGNRRWNFTFKTGQVLALPEGDENSAKALMTFARLDGVNRLLGGKVAAFDMRAGDRIYLRVPGRTDPVEQPAPKPAASETKKTEDAPKAQAEVAAKDSKAKGDKD
ncbi:MAG: cell division protein FtsQ/DivIB [Novosphingobium sp.]|uniref:cell division protein FtsQ/DivIB n=1 Tax=Novosphingobium sp. TaxID=1874826 RepID=UPI00391CC6B9|nr:FtsQ-type POTRA domain-containing protein [Novosphingobium sp.]